MAKYCSTRGYLCEFVDSVHEIFYCKKCSLVARRLTFTSCCGESYCHACIADIQQQGQSCPACGQQSFSTIKPLKYQRQLDSLRMYCCMRGRGCDWLGTLDQLDTHLDPEQNNCQFVDVKCPLHCQQTISRNMMEQHMARECLKRDYACQHCDFRASYEVVVDTHLPECIYFPLQCPNFCGVTCERDVMGDHMRTCLLEEVACEFCGVGCNGRFRRENQEEHAQQNNQKHLTMTAVRVAAAVEMNQQLQQKLQEQEKKLQEQEEKLQQQEEKLQQQQEKLQEQEEKLLEEEEKLQEQEEKLQEQEGKLQQQEEKLQQQEEKLQQQEEKLQEQEEKLQEQEESIQKLLTLLHELDKRFIKLQEKSDQNELIVKEVSKFICLRRTFVMKDFSKEKDKDMNSDWESPAMYTHVCGYKFCIGIDANGYGNSRGEAMVVQLWAVPGEYDDQLKWPAQASFTIELIHQHGGANIKGTCDVVKWLKPQESFTHIYTFRCILYGSLSYAFLEHSKVEDFLDRDRLYFHLNNITVY